MSVPDGGYRGFERVARMAGGLVPALAALALLSLPGGAAAQQLPGSVDPGRLQQRFAPPAPPAAPPPALPTTPLDAPPAELRDLRFVLGAIRVEGATVYPPAELAPIWAADLGREIPLARLYEIANRISTRYRRDGYVLSRAIVPPQDIVGGVATIQVIEGYIDRLLLNGEFGGRAAILQAFAEKIVASRPLRAPVLERYLLLMQDLPGLAVRSVIRPSPDVPGASDLILLVGHDFTGAFVQGDNRGTRFNGPEQMQAAATLNSPFGWYETLAAQTAFTPGVDETRFYSLSASLPLGAEGLSLSLSAGRLTSRPGSTLDVLEVEGRSETYRLGLSYPFIRARRRNLRLRAGLDLLNSETDVLREQISKDRVRSLRIALDYDGIDRYRGVNRASAEISRGLDILGARSANAESVSRQGGRNDYTKVTADLSRVQFLQRGWSLQAAGRGQYAFDRLLSSEEFGVGGQAFGRSYDGSEILGSHGLAGSLELRYEPAPPDVAQDLQLYAFYDIGAVWQRNEFPKRARESAASAGFGMRATIAESLTGYIELTRPLTRVPTTDRDDRERGFRLFISLSAFF